MKLKKVFLGVCLVSILGFSAVAVAAGKIAILSMQELLLQLPQRREVENRLDAEFEGRANKLRLMQGKLAEKFKRSERDSTVMNKAQVAALEKELSVLNEQYVTQVKKFNQDRNRRQMEEDDKLLQQIKKAAQQVATQKGYDFVLDDSAVLYATPSVDITADVVKAIKK